MKLKKNSFHYKFYKFTYMNEPPQNLCPYFWESMLAILAFPVSFIGIIGKKATNDFSISNIGAGVIISGILILAAIFLDSLGFISYVLFQAGMAGVIVIGAALLFIILVGLLIAYIPIVLGFIKARLSALCPIVEWE